MFFRCQSFSLKKGKLLKNVGCSRKSVVFSLEFQWTSSLRHYNTEHTEKKPACAKLLTQQVSSKKLMPAYATQVLAYARPWSDTTNTTHMKGGFEQCSYTPFGTILVVSLKCTNFQQAEGRTCHPPWGIPSSFRAAFMDPNLLMDMDFYSILYFTEVLALQLISVQHI